LKLANHLAGGGLLCWLFRRALRGGNSRLAKRAHQRESKDEMASAQCGSTSGYRPEATDNITRSDQLALWKRAVQAAAWGRSGQGECQEARTQQHEARRGQRQKSAGNDIVVLHVTPATLDAGPN
jgi:hypothetical protein